MSSKLPENDCGIVAIRPKFSCYAWRSSVVAVAGFLTVVLGQV